MSANEKSYDGFTAEERDAMKEHAKELKATKRRGAKADTEPDVLAKIAEMGDADRALAERFHALVKENAPGLTAKLWYGMPAYARDGKVVCFFQSAEKFKARYATVGFSDQAALDEDTLWPTSYALTGLDPATEKRIAALLAQAAG
ncbi:iron chaperone [Streptomyces tanashiensis]|uniref:iron chaperone n=1 Tax=Streptomyces tanashiensis TaxID=67367 RepID=UPI0033D868E8